MGMITLSPVYTLHNATTKEFHHGTNYHASTDLIDDQLECPWIFHSLVQILVLETVIISLKAYTGVIDQTSAVHRKRLDLKCDFVYVDIKHKQCSSSGKE
ncbi:hypothetical protein CHS0354_017737, partial [Potamilus streckersoni]